MDMVRVPTAQHAMLCPMGKCGSLLFLKTGRMIFHVDNLAMCSAMITTLDMTFALIVVAFYLFVDLDFPPESDPGPAQAALGLIILSRSATDRWTSPSAGRLTIKRYSTSWVRIFLITPFLCPLGGLDRLGPLGVLPRDILLSSLYSRFHDLRSCLAARRACRLGAAFMAPPVTREIRDPLLTGWLGSLNRELKPFRASVGTASDEPW